MPSLSRSSLSRGIICAVLVLLGLLLPACERSAYNQNSPDATIRTARLMIENKEAGRLPDLIYAPTQDFRALMRRLGILTARLQETAEVLQAKFPNEVQSIKEAAEKDAAGSASQLLNSFSQQRQRRGPPNPDDRSRDQFNEIAKQIFSDPFGWLRDSEQRLTTLEIDDTTVAVLMDGQPVLAPIGLVMKKADDGKWYFVLPTSLPGVGQFMPQSRFEHQIMASLFKVFDNALVDLQNDIRGGKVASLEDVARATGEKAFIPAAMTLFAYNRAMESRKKEAAEAKKVAPATPPG